MKQEIEKILSSKEIIDRAIAEYNPYAIVLLLSGGDDSLTALQVAKYLNVPITHIMHGVTGTGIQETTEFVRTLAASEKPIYLEANAGDSYVNYVMRKGFFGVGKDAHKFSYHILKAEHFRKTVSKNIRKHKHNRKILFVNGARKSESVNRSKNLTEAIRADGSNIWVNIIHDWDRPSCISFLESESIKRNPVAVQLCRSGECLCGTTQSRIDRIEASLIYPKWGKWIDSLDKVIKEKFGFGWGEEFPKPRKIKTQLDLFQPMCVGCEKHFEDNQHLF